MRKWIPTILVSHHYKNKRTVLIVAYSLHAMVMHLETYMLFELINLTFCFLLTALAIIECEDKGEMSCLQSINQASVTNCRSQYARKLIDNGNSEEIFVVKPLNWQFTTISSSTIISSSSNDQKPVKKQKREIDSTFLSPVESIDRVKEQSVQEIKAQSPKKRKLEQLSSSATAGVYARFV